MTEQSKFAGVLGRLKQPREVPAARSQPAREEQATMPPAIAPESGGRGGQGRGRRAGKRSDPAFSSDHGFRAERNAARGARLLEDQDAGKDLSDLLEELLTNWIAEN